MSSTVSFSSQRGAWALSMLAILVVGCGGSDGRAPEPTLAEVVPLERTAYRCSSRHATSLVGRCLEPERAGSVAEQVHFWKPSAGDWLSLQIENIFFKNKFNLSQAEVNCLIQTLCREKIP